MKVRILGCCGGIGSTDARTTSLLIDDDILIDAGTGLMELSLDEMVKINHIFLTHAHLDHTALLPLMIDSVASIRKSSITIHGLHETVDALQKHIFNWMIWPDFSKIKINNFPVINFESFYVGDKILIEGRSFLSVHAEHTVPAVGYCVDSGNGSLFFSGDTTINSKLWPFINAIDNLRYLIIETAFSDSQNNLAQVSKHLCSSMLVDEINNLKSDVEVYISHLKPNQAGQIMQEINMQAGSIFPKRLEKGQIFHF